MNSVSQAGKLLLFKVYLDVAEQRNSFTWMPLFNVLTSERSLFVFGDLIW